jgi:hypothetical protein
MRQWLRRQEMLPYTLGARVAVLATSHPEFLRAEAWGTSAAAVAAIW